MTWLRIDDGFTDNEKIDGLTHPAFRLHVAALCLCARLLTDGRITEANLRKLAAGVRVSAARYVPELVEARLWSEHPKGGWKIKDYLEYNPSSVKVKEDRARNAERQARYMTRRKTVTDGVSDSVTDSAPSPNYVNTKNNHYVGPEDVTSTEDVNCANELMKRVESSLRSVA